MSENIDSSKIKELQKLVAASDSSLLEIWKKCDQSVDENGTPMCEKEYEWGRMVMTAQIHLSDIQAQLKKYLVGEKK